jgi:type VI secretion system secreted protein Hcp
MSTEYFMKIDGITGDTTDAKHPGEIKVSTWSWGESKVPPPIGGGGATRADLQDLHFTARSSIASPVLFLNCAAGTQSAGATLTVRRPGTNPFEYLKITLTDVLISSYQAAGNENDDVPIDQVSLYFNRIQVSYIPQNKDGTAGTAVTRIFDRTTGKSV